MRNVRRRGAPPERPDSAVYPPAQVAELLQVSTATLRWYAQAYERVYGELPRDGDEERLYPEEAIERLQVSRELVQRGESQSMAAALKHLPEDGKGPSESLPGPAGRDDPGLLLEELQRLRELVEEQNLRLASLESKLDALLPVPETRREDPGEASIIPKGEDPRAGAPRPWWRRLFFWSIKFRRRKEKRPESSVDQLLHAALIYADFPDQETAAIGLHLREGIGLAEAREFIERNLDVIEELARAVEESDGDLPRRLADATVKAIQDSPSRRKWLRERQPPAPARPDDARQPVVSPDRDE